jgi:hypothetical protein
MPDLRSEISALAASFADAVLAAVRGASLEELLSEHNGAPRRRPERPRGPRVLKTGLAKKVLRSKGQKRARQYFAS